MGKTLLIGHHGVSWRDWLKEHRGNRDLLCLDPAESYAGPPARFVLVRGNRPVYHRFYGSLDAQRAPHVMMASLAQALFVAEEDALIQLFPYRPFPLLRQIVALIAQLVQPSAILVAQGTALDLDGFPVGPEEVELGKSFPLLVMQAQRKAQWMKLMEQCQEHDVDLRQVTIEGARFGSGENLTREVEGVLYAERCGSTLLMVSDEELSDAQIARALDSSHTARAHLVSPEAYRNLLCSFGRPNGEDFGMGTVAEIDWESLRARVLCTAIPPAPVRILRLGSLRIDPHGNELGEAKPWQV
ncbi:MAG TPA: hypothetical protein VGE01_09445 [Fimbriimonas sp.]